MRLIMFLVAAGTCARSAAACDLCSVYAATEAQGGAGKGFFGGVAEQYTYFSTFQVDGKKVTNTGDQYLSSSVSQVFLGYNFNARLGLQVNLPVIYREYGYNSGRGSDLGIGDVSLLANVRLYEKITENFTCSWTALGGLKLPTGDSSLLNPKLPDFAPGIGGHDLALGSGSLDGIVGTSIFLRWHKVFLTGAMQYAIRSEGDFGYQYANDWTWLGGPGVYLWLKHEHTLALQAVVSGETKGADTIHGADTDDTSETIVYVGPQLIYSWSNKLSAMVGLDIPVSIESTGEQLVPDFRVRAALTWRF